MKRIRTVVITMMFLVLSCAALDAALAQAVCPYDMRCLATPYGAGSRYAPNGLRNPYGPRGSRYSNQSWNNPYATDAPKLYDQQGRYRGRLSVNPYHRDSLSNPYGRYGSRYSPDSLNNPYGAGAPGAWRNLWVK